MEPILSFSFGHKTHRGADLMAPPRREQCVVPQCVVAWAPFRVADGLWSRSLMVDESTRNHGLHLLPMKRHVLIHGCVSSFGVRSRMCGNHTQPVGNMVRRIPGPNSCAFQYLPSVSVVNDDNGVSP